MLNQIHQYLVIGDPSGSGLPLVQAVFEHRLQVIPYRYELIIASRMLLRFVLKFLE